MEKEEKNVEMEFTQREEYLEAKGKELSEGEKQVRQVDSAFQMVENRLKVVNQKMQEIQSMREFQAIHKEIDQLNQQKQQLIDQKAQKESLFEQLQKEWNSLQEERTHCEVQVKARQVSFSHQKQGWEKEKEILEQKRIQFKKQLPARVLNRYERIRQACQGIAIVLVKPTDKNDHDHHCQGCHKILPPQLCNELRKDQALLSCIHCHRILYLSMEDHLKDEDVQFA